MNSRHFVPAIKNVNIKQFLQELVKDLYISLSQ